MTDRSGEVLATGRASRFRRISAQASVWAVLAWAPVCAFAAPPAEALRRQAFDHAYNMEFDRGLALARQAVGADPGNPANHLALASVSALMMLAARGSLTVEEYLGPPPSGDVTRRPPPADLAATFKAAIDAASAIAGRRAREHPHDIDAVFAAGAADGFLAAYLVSEEGRLMAGLGAARRAFTSHERVLQMDGRRKDAGLVLGSYRYAVASLPLVKRWLAYLVGFGGDKNRAVALVEACAAYPSEVQTEARLALVVMYTRERRLGEALERLRELRELYPRNRLLRLETGAMLLRSGRPAEALAWLDAGVAALSDDPRPAVFGERAMWHYKRGMARAALGRATDARQDAEAAMSLPSPIWVRGRVFLLLGHAEDLAGNRLAAIRAYRSAAETCRRVNDADGVQAAELWLDKPYSGTSAVPARHTQ